MKNKLTVLQLFVAITVLLLSQITTQKFTIKCLYFTTVATLRKSECAAGFSGEEDAVTVSAILDETINYEYHENIDENRNLIKSSLSSTESG